MKVDGQLESATLEQLATDPSANTQGRIYDNITSGKTMYDSGTQKRAILKNDAKLIIGNDPSEANNVRIHKAASGVVQDVAGDDTTPEGTSSTSIAQRATRDENLTSGTLPAAGNIGRHAYLTDEKTLAEDDGTAWRRHVPEYPVDDATAGSTITLAPVTSSVVRLTGVFSTLNMIPAGYPAQRVTLINRSGADVAIGHDNGATPANRILTGTGANLTFKSNSSISLYYDATTQRWQVIGEVAGAAATGGGVPNSAVITVTSNYTALITDDIILVDTSLGPISVTLPSAAGNLGLRLLFEKIGSRQNNVLTLLGTINGIVNEEIWALNAPYEIVSDGTNWKTVSSPDSTVIFEGPDINNILNVVAVSTTNVVLETFRGNFPVIDGITPNVNNLVLLKNQTVPEENGLYLPQATAISIDATANANVAISTLANGSVVPASPSPVIVSTGQKVSLRFQTIPTENGIYVVGATAGTSVRDTSQRHPSYVNPTSLKDLVMYADFYNYPVASILAAATNSGGLSNDKRFWKQTNDNLTTFTGAVFSNISSITYNIKTPSNARMIDYEVCGAGGAGGAGTTVNGGGGGSGALPLNYSNKVTPGATVSVTIPIGGIPGGGGGPFGASQAADASISFGSGNGSITVKSGQPGSTSAGGNTTGINAGGANYTNGGGPNIAGLPSVFAGGGSVGTGGASFAGGGGGAGKTFGGTGGNGSSAANFVGANAYLPFAGITYFGSGGGGGGRAPVSGRPGRGGFSGPAYIKLTWR